MMDSLTNEGMLDRMYIDYRTYVNKSVWTVHLKRVYGSEYKYELWHKWLRL